MLMQLASFKYVWMYRFPFQGSLHSNRQVSCVDHELIPLSRSAPNLPLNPPANSRELWHEHHGFDTRAIASASSGIARP